jgi:hypothetical protein
VLGAKVGEVTYYVAPGVVNLWAPSKRYAAFDGKAATVWPVEGGMSLTNAIAWCERDAELEALSHAAHVELNVAQTLEAEAAARTLALNRYRAWYRMNAAPPSAQAPKAQSAEERAADLKGQSLDDIRDGLKRLKREVAAMRPEPPSVEERLAALEERVKWSPDSRLVEERLMEFESRLTQFVASKCQALYLRINERLKKLEAKA